MNANLLSSIKQKSYKSDEGVILLSDYLPNQTLEEAYLKVRAKENRVLSDSIVNVLPNIPKTVPHAKEWIFRKATSVQFCKHLHKKTETVRILDLGCGNGWFSNRMASNPSMQVIGIDLNLPELKQAQRLFSSNKVLFCYGNIFDNLFKQEEFDYIVLNASVQYFSSIPDLFKLLFLLLKPSGEIYILDSPFYEDNEVEQARRRTSIYYESLEQSEMINYYFHHSYKSLAPFNPIYKNIQVPFLDRIFRKAKHPFLWVSIKKAL